MGKTVGYINQRELYRKKLARPEGFEPPTFGFEVHFDASLISRANDDFPEKIKQIALGTISQN